MLHRGRAGADERGEHREQKRHDARALQLYDKESALSEQRSVFKKLREKCIMAVDKLNHLMNSVTRAAFMTGGG